MIDGSDWTELSPTPPNSKLLHPSPPPARSSPMTSTAGQHSRVHVIGCNASKVLMLLHTLFHNILYADALCTAKYIKKIRYIKVKFEPNNF